MKRALAIIFVLTVSSCTEQLPEFKATEVGDIFSVALDQASVEANGYSFYTITATFKPDVAPDKRKVTYTTDLGNFTNGKNEIEVVANDLRQSTVFLHSGTPGAGKVKATVDGKYSIDIPVNFTEVTAPYTLTISPDPGNPVQANGIDSYQLTFTFNTSLPQAQRKVALTTSSGQFANGKQDISLLANENNVVSTTLSSTVITPAIVGISSNERKYQDITLSFKVPSPNFTLQGVSSGEVAADNSSTYKIEVTFSQFINLSDRTAELESDKGTFSNGTNKITVIANSDNKASAFIKSAESGNVVVKATYKNLLTQETSVNFVRAFPDKIHLTSPEFSLKAGLENQIAFTTRLTRDVGTPSFGFDVEYVALDTMKRTVGSFINETRSTAAGESTVSYSAGPALDKNNNKTYRGKLKIISSMKLQHAVLTDSVFIFITD
ncbi:MAG TPA: hypothetical protein VGD40_25385 [Chryseosolibacter sp.]